MKNLALSRFANKIPCWSCEICFYPPGNGGRETTFPTYAFQDNSYKPHIVEECLSTRSRVLSPNEDSKLIAVLFANGPLAPKAGVYLTVDLIGIFAPNKIYDSISCGKVFFVREGRFEVAKGLVISERGLDPAEWVRFR